MPRLHISSGSIFEREIGYSRAVVESGWIFVSGTTGYDYEKMALAEGVVAQCEQAFRNIQAALQQAGARMEDVVRATFILQDRADWPSCCNAAWMLRKACSHCATTPSASAIFS
jgi:enamine deaminase RidA (YjgF/YER057c/UK114 family)